MSDPTLSQIEETKYKVPITRLKMRPEFNYKSVTRDSIDKLKKSLLEDGQLTPILVNGETDAIIGGHHQYVAIKELIEENKWLNSNLVWIEPRIVKDMRHEKILSLKHNTQYDIADSEVLAEWGKELVDTIYDLSEIPVVTDYPQFSLLDVMDKVGPSAEKEVDPTTPKEEKLAKCPSCGTEFSV